jgi:dGTPase
MTIIDLRLEEERQRLRHPLACHSERTRGRRLAEPPDLIRTVFERDGHRILHAKPFRRLRNKTQVFFAPENDHMATRMDHSLYVATISRTICRALGLNDDLAFAVALGHDLGHAPFGHSGEVVLERLLNRDLPVGAPRREYGHESQSLRVVDCLGTLSGHTYRGLNLTYEVRDGIRCHCGESQERAIRPRSADEVADPSTFRGRARLPITLESCVVRLADRVAYLGRDYEDALVALPDTLPPLPDVVTSRLGADNRQIINSLVLDLVAWNQAHPEELGFSEPVADAMAALRTFNYRHIYHHPRLEEYRRSIEAVLERIFDALGEYLDRTPRAEWTAPPPDAPRWVRSFAAFLRGADVASEAAAAEPPARLIVDYVSLMTDHYAFKAFQEIALPRPIV